MRIGCQTAQLDEEVSGCGSDAPTQTLRSRATTDPARRPACQAEFGGAPDSFE